MKLITGVTGMLGSHLAYTLLQTEDKIRAIKRKNSKIGNTLKTFQFYISKAEAQKLFTKIEWVEADILDYQSIYEALEGIDEVYHVAAIISFNPAERQNIIDNNTKGTANIVNASLQQNIKKFCHISSIAALGQETNNPITEKSVRSSDIYYTGYQQSKYMSELEVWRAAEEGLNVVILNPPIILGISPKKREGSTSLFYNIEKGLRFYTNGVTGYIDIHDVVNVAIILMNKKIYKERFIINSENISYREILNLISDEFETKRPKYYANKLMLSLAWRLEKIKTVFTRKSPVITKDVVKSAASIDKYSSQKISETIDYQFMPITESIKKNVAIYKKMITL